MSDSALKAVYAGDDILHLCVRYVSTHLTWVEEFKDDVFFKTKKKCGFSVCEFIITRYILHLQWKLVCFFYWTAPCQTVTGIQSLFSQLVRLTVEPEIYQQFVEMQDLPRAASTAQNSVESLRAEGWSGFSERSDSAGKWHRKCDSQLQRVGQYVSRMQRRRGGKRVRQRDTVPYSCAWGADGLLSMSSLFSFSGLSSIQPLHRHSGWVSQQGYSVYVCVCRCMQGCEYLCRGVINWRWSSQWAYSCTVPCQNRLSGQSKGDRVTSVYDRMCGGRQEE